MCRFSSRSLCPPISIRITSAVCTVELNRCSEPPPSFLFYLSLILLVPQEEQLHDGSDHQQFPGSLPNRIPRGSNPRTLVPPSDGDGHDVRQTARGNFIETSSAPQQL